LNGNDILSANPQDRTERATASVRTPAVSPATAAACLLALLHRHTAQSPVALGWLGNSGRWSITSADVDQDTTLHSLERAVPKELASVGSVGTDSLDSSSLPPVLFVACTAQAADSAEAAVSLSQMGLVLVSQESGCLVRLNVDASRQTPQAASEFLDQYAQLIRLASARPDATLVEHSLVTETGSRFIPDPTAAIPATPYPLLSEAFVAVARRSPQAVAVRQSGRTWSYSAIEESSAKLASRLCELGVTPEHVVAVTGPRSFGTVSSILGVFRSGGVLLTIDPKLPQDRQLLIAKQAGAAFLVRVGGSTPLDAQIPACVSVDAFTGLAADGAGAHPGDASSSLPVLDPGKAAYIFFTSGSTGTPKGVVGCHRGLAHFLDWQRKTFEIGPGDRAAQVTTLSFDMVLRDMFLALTSGATLSIPADEDVLDPTAILRWMAVEEISVLHVVPSLLRAWTNNAPDGLHLPALRRVFLAGEPLTDTLINNFRNRFGDGALITNFYGPTETTLIKCFHPVVGEPEPGIQPIGRPQPQTQILILNKRNQLCGLNEMGEIAIRTPFRTLGYLNAPETTAKVFVPNPFRTDPTDLIYLTGDSGCYRTDGILVMKGRMDGQVKIRGVRVEPGEIEATLAKCPGVREAAVVAHQAQDGGKFLAAYVVCDGVRPDGDVAAMRNFLKQTLPEALVPSVFVPLAALPLLPNGKVNRKKLQPDMPSLQASDTRADGVAQDLSPREAELLAIWQSVLGHQRVGVNDSFIELGGDSLTAIAALVRMQRLGIPAAMARGIFQGRTIRQIAAAPDDPQATEASAPMPTKARANMLVNVLRGVLVFILVMGHWFEGLLNRLPASLSGLGEVAMPLFNAATPGFALLFGLSLGYTFLPRFAFDAPGVTRALYRAAGIVGIGVVVRSVTDLGVFALGGKAIDSTMFFGSLYSALLYYALALLTAPWWFRFISRWRNAYLPIAVLMLAAFGIFKLAQMLVLYREQEGFLQLLRLMVVAKFNYFNMSVGALAGLAAGQWLHSWTSRNAPMEQLVPPLLGLGVVLTVAGLLLVWVTTGGIWALHDAANMPLWKWVFYAGTVLLAASVTSRVLAHYEERGVISQKALNVTAVLGQISLPVFVIHTLVLRGKALLVLIGVPGSLALLVPLALFFGACFWMMRQLYQMYYGPASPQGPQGSTAEAGA
jgi:amino acid adenylation domain-containing protein